MQPDEGTKEDLVRYRIEKAKEDLPSAKTLLEAKDYRWHLLACPELTGYSF